MPQYETIASVKLNRSERGWRIVQGKIVRIGNSRKSTWLNMEGGLGIRIDHKDASYFQGINLQGLKGKLVTARGWLYAHKGALRMRVRHPAALELE